MRWLMFCTLKLLQRIRLRTLVSTHTPKTSHFQSNCNLTDCYRFCLSTPLITIPQPLSPSSWNFRARSHESLSMLWLRFSCWCQFSFFPVCLCRPGDLLPDYGLCRCVSRSCRCSRSVWQLLSSIMNAGFFDFSNRFFVLCSLGKFCIDPFARHITVPTQLHCKFSFARVHSDVFGTQIPGCLFLKPSFLHLSFLFFMCSVESFILFRMLVMNLYLSSGEFCFFLAVIQSFLLAQRVPSYPTRSPGCATPACAFILNGFQDLPSSFLFAGIATISYFSTFSFSSGNRELYSFFRGTSNPWRAVGFLQFSHTKGQLHLHPYLPGHNAGSCLVLDPRLSSGIISSLSLFPILSFSQCLLCPWPVFASKRRRRYTHGPPIADIFPPRNILAHVYLDVFPKGFCCRLHTFFQSVACLPLNIHHTSHILNSSSKRNLQHPFEVPRIISSSSSEAYVLVHHRLAGLGSKSTFAASSMKSFNICCKCFLVGYDPEVVSPHKTAYLMHSSAFSFYLQENSVSFLHPIFLHIGQDLGFHFLPQARGFHASVPHTSIEDEPAFHTFKCGFASQLRHLKQEVCYVPSMCIVIIHDLSHMLQLCHVKSPFWYPSLPCTSSVLPPSRVSSRDFFLLAFPSVFAASSSPSLVGVGNLSHSPHQYADFSTFRALFPSPDATRYMMHTTWTSQMSVLLLCSFWSPSSGQRRASSKRPVSQPSMNWGIPSDPEIVPESTLL